jgi:hypothetical protein
MEDRLKSLLTLVPWTLQRLLHYEFEVEWDTNGALETLEMDPRYGSVPAEAMEEFLKTTEAWVGLEELRDRLTPGRISEALGKVEPLGLFEKLGYLRCRDLLHADWPAIVASVYWGYRRFSRDMLLATIDARIGLARRIPLRNFSGGASYAEFEAGMQLLNPDALPAAVAEYVVGEMSESFSGMVERLSTFQVTAVTGAVPPAVQQYAREACRCYLHGFFSAALILCRSCVESAIETKLEQRGLRKELDRLPFNSAGTAQARSQLGRLGRPGPSLGRRDSQKRQQSRPRLGTLRSGVPREAGTDESGASPHLRIDKRQLGVWIWYDCTCFFVGTSPSRLRCKQRWRRFPRRQDTLQDQRPPNDL